MSKNRIHELQELNYSKQERRIEMKKNEKSPKNPKKEEVKKDPNKEPKKEPAKKEKRVVTLKELKDVVKGPLEPEKTNGAPKKSIKEKEEKSSQPKAPKSTPWKAKIPQDIEAYVKEQTEKGKKPKDLISTVVEMFDRIKKLDNEKATQKRAARTLWQIRHEMGVTRKPKS